MSCPTRNEYRIQILEKRVKSLEKCVLRLLEAHGANVVEAFSLIASKKELDEFDE